MIGLFLSGCNPAVTPIKPTQLIEPSQAVLTPTILSMIINTPTSKVVFNPEVTSTTVEMVAKEKILILNYQNTLTLSDPDLKEAHSYQVEPQISSAVLSPDGKKIAYISEIPTSHIMYILNIQSGQSIQISKGLFGGVSDMIAWSRNGDQLGLSLTAVESSIGQISLMDASSGTITQLTNFSSGFPSNIVIFGSWSVDGNIIGFTTQSLPSQGGSSQGTIQLLDVKSRQIRTILDEKNGGDINNIGGSWITVDGKSIFFGGKRNGYYRIFSIDIDGNNIKQITPNDIKFDVNGPVVFSPDGKSFFAYANDLKAVNPDGVPTLFSINGELIRQLNGYPGKVVSWIRVAE